MLKRIMALSISLIMALTAGLAAAQEAKPPMMVDVLTMQDGKTYDDALAYFDLVIPIIEGHGLKRVSSMEVVGKMAGHDAVSPQIVQVWEIQAEDAMTAIFSDPEYLQHVPMRDALFRMDLTQLWMTQERQIN